MGHPVYLTAICESIRTLTAANFYEYRHESLVRLWILRHLWEMKVTLDKMEVVLEDVQLKIVTSCLVNLALLKNILRDLFFTCLLN